MAAIQVAFGIPAPGMSVDVNAVAPRGESELAVANRPNCESYRRLLKTIGTSDATYDNDWAIPYATPRTQR